MCVPQSALVEMILDPALVNRPLMRIGRPIDGYTGLCVVERSERRRRWSRDALDDAFGLDEWPLIVELTSIKTLKRAVLAVIGTCNGLNDPEEIADKSWSYCERASTHQPLGDTADPFSNMPKES